MEIDQTLAGTHANIVSRSLTTGQTLPVVLLCTPLLLTGIILAVWCYQRRQKKRFAEELAEAILTSRARRAAWEARAVAMWETGQAWAIEGERIRTMAVLEGLVPEVVRTDRSDTR